MPKVANKRVNERIDKIEVNQSRHNNRFTKLEDRVKMLESNSRKAESLIFALIEHIEKTEGKLPDGMVKTNEKEGNGSGTKKDG